MMSMNAILNPNPYLHMFFGVLGFFVTFLFALPEMRCSRRLIILAIGALIMGPLLQVYVSTISVVSFGIVLFAAISLLLWEDSHRQKLAALSAFGKSGWIVNG